MDGAGRTRLVAIEQHRIEEGPGDGIAGLDARIVRVAGDDFGIGGEIADARANLLALFEAGERAHAHGLVSRIADDGLAEARAQAFDQCVAVGMRGDDATDRRAFLAGLHRHLADDFLDEEVELFRAGRGIKAKHGGVEAVGLHGESHGIFDDGPVRPEALTRRGRTCEGHGVLSLDMVEQVADRAADELQCAFRQNAGVDDAADHQFGEIGRLARRLDDSGNAGQQCRRQLFQHAPAGEIEGVDMHRNALQGAEDMLRGEGIVL